MVKAAISNAWSPTLLLYCRKYVSRSGKSLNEPGAGGVRVGVGEASTVAVAVAVAVALAAPVG
jgi:hypothetical protein